MMVTTKCNKKKINNKVFTELLFANESVFKFCNAIKWKWETHFNCMYLYVCIILVWCYYVCASKGYAFNLICYSYPISNTLNFCFFVVICEEFPWCRVMQNRNGKLFYSCCKLMSLFAACHLFLEKMQTINFYFYLYFNAGINNEFQFSFWWYCAF